MNAILARLVGAKGAWKFILDFVIYMVQAQKLKIPGAEKLEEVLEKLLRQYGNGVGVWSKLSPLVVNAAKSIKELYVGVCEAFGFAR